MGLNDFSRRRNAAESAIKLSESTTLARIELQELIEKIPDSLDSALSRVFPTAQYVDSGQSATGFGYRSLIDNRPVRKTEHRRISKWVLDQLVEIISWCGRHNVQVKPLIVEAEVRAEKRFGQAMCASKFSPLFWLAILDELDSGKKVADLLPTVMESNVKTLLTAIGEIVPAAMVAIGLDAKKEAPIQQLSKEPAKRIHPTAHESERDCREWTAYISPGTWYPVFGMNPQQWRTALRTVWIPDGDARRDKLKPKRGKVQFRKSLLSERNLTEPK